MDPVTDKYDIAEIRQLLTEHIAATGSPKAKDILAHLDEKASCFKKILPRDYDRMMRTIAEFEGQGISREQAEIEAFNASIRD
jgi:glutamate synthase (ferredoxin)